MGEPDRDSQFLRWSLDLVDTGITAVLPTYTLDVFKVIWRFTMRGVARDEKVPANLIYADVSQNMISALVGCGRQWVSTCIGVLEDMKWLKRLGTPSPGGQQRYALGNLKVITPKKPPTETYWALTLSKALMDEVSKLEALEPKSFWEDRPEKVRDMLVTQGVALPPLRRPAQRKGQKAVKTEALKGSSEGSTLSPEATGGGRLRLQGGRLRRQGWSPEATGGGRLRLQGGVASDDTLNREPTNREPLNREPLNISASADASPPASASGSGDFEPPAPETLAGSDATNSDDSDHDESSAENSDSAEVRAAYREWVFSDEDAAEVVDEDGDAVVPDKDEDMNETEERRLKALKSAQNAATNAKRQMAVNEQKRNKLNGDKQREKNLSGPNLERHIPKGSVKRMERAWLKAFDEHYPDFSPAKWWIPSGKEGKLRPGKETGLVSQLVQMYSPDAVEKYLTWAVAHWGEIQTRFKSVPPVPAINFLYGFRESLLPEAVLGNESERVEEELRVWGREHPNEDYPPELLARVKALKGRG